PISFTPREIAPVAPAPVAAPRVEPVVVANPIIEKEARKPAIVNRNTRLKGWGARIAVWATVTSLGLAGNAAADAFMKPALPVSAQSTETQNPENQPQIDLPQLIDQVKEALKPTMKEEGANAVADAKKYSDNLAADVLLKLTTAEHRLDLLEA